MLFHYIKARLEKQNWYLDIRYHPFVLSIWFKLRKSVSRDLYRRKIFYQSLLKDVAGDLIIDAGANEGFLTEIFAKCGFKVIAIEPSPRNAKILRSRFRLNAAVTVVPFAISNERGRKTFFESKTDYALNTLSTKWKNIGEQRSHSNKLYSNSFQIETITLDEVIQNFGVPAFIKIDVEGHEESALKGLNRPVPLLSFEAILPDFLNETMRSIEHLNSFSDCARFNYIIDNKLAYKSFITKQEVISSIQSLPPQTIEIICRSESHSILNPSN